MKAIIFAAGLGTRLKPLTNSCPKALIKLNSEPLLWYAIQKLISAGASELVVNIHHFGEQVIEYISQKQFPVPIHISDERNLLLDTGGGLLKAKNWLKGNEPVIAYNVDIISSIDLTDVIKQHRKNKALATLVVRNRKTSRYLMFTDEMKLTGWHNASTGEKKISGEGFEQSLPWAFSGIQVLSPKIFDLINEQGKFSVIELYLRLAKNHTICGYKDMSEFWIDVGKAGQLELAEQYLSAKH